MSEDLGQPLTGGYSISGGEAQLFELGLTVQADGGKATLGYGFPMIGRRNIVTSELPGVPLRPSGNARFTFKSIETDLTAKQITSLTKEALAGRLALTPVGQASVQLPLGFQAVFYWFVGLALAGD